MSPSAPAAAAPIGAAELAAALQPHLDGVVAALDGTEQDRVVIDAERGLEASGWELHAARSGLRVEPGHPEAWLRLVPEALASSSLSRATVAAGGDDATAGRDALVAHTVATLLAADVQRAVDERVRAAQLEEARRLTTIRHRLRGEIVDLLPLLVERPPAIDTSSDGSTRSTESMRLDEGLSWNKPSGRDATGRPAESRTRREPTTAPDTTSRSGPVLTIGRPTPRRRLRILLAVLLVSAAALAVMVGDEMLAPEAEPVVPPDGSASTAVREVVSRPPSVAVVVEPEVWNSLDREERLAVIRGLGADADRKGYRGVIARTPDRRMVGRWLRHEGPSLVEPER